MRKILRTNTKFMVCHISCRASFVWYELGLFQASIKTNFTTQIGQLTHPDPGLGPMGPIEPIWGPYGPVEAKETINPHPALTKGPPPFQEIDSRNMAAGKL